MKCNRCKRTAVEGFKSCISCRANQKKYRENNKEKLKEYEKEYNKEYRKKNKEKIKEQQKEYSQTPNGKRHITINNWKQGGLIETKDYTFNSLYDRYLNTHFCERCNVALESGNSKNARCMDHDHYTRIFRNVICISCNSKLPRQPTVKTSEVLQPQD